MLVFVLVLDAPGPHASTLRAPQKSIARQWRRQKVNYGLTLEELNDYSFFMANSVPKSKIAKTNQHASVRRDHATEIAEDYVEAIADLIAADGECRLTEIAKHFAVSHVTVNRTIARLKRDGLVRSEPYGPIQLTPAGKRLAERCKRRHGIVYEFLLALGVSPVHAAIDAEGIEHHVGQETLLAMEQFSRSSSSATSRP